MRRCDVSPAQVISRLTAIREPRMRVLALIADLAAHPPTDWITVFDEVFLRARARAEVDAQLVVECLTHAAADPGLAYPVRQALYEAAVERGRPAIARLFLTSSPARALPPALQKELGPERALRPAGRPLTLGERKSLARTHSREQLGLLLRDPHPAVVRILLDNPHLTEADVVRVAAMRPAVPETLALLAAHAKWSVRHAVKRAIVLNPATPLADAIRVATTLGPRDLVEIAADVALPEALRMHAASLIV
jgi:hypothetical protein